MAGAEAVMPDVKTYPFDRPKARRINMNIQSEEINGWPTSGDEAVGCRVCRRRGEEDDEQHRRLLP